MTGWDACLVKSLLVNLAGGLEFPQLFIVLGQEIGDLEIVRILLVGQLQFLEAQLGLPHQLVVVRILRQPGDFAGRLTLARKEPEVSSPLV